MASANLFQQYLQPARSVADYTADLDKAEATQIALQGQRRQNELAALTADQTRQTMLDQQSGRNAIAKAALAAKGADGAYSLDAHINALRATGNTLAITQADSLEKQSLERLKTEAATSKDKAEADTKSFELKMRHANQAISDIASLDTADDAVRSLQSHLAAGDIDQQKYQSVLATLQPTMQDPAAFSRWKRNMVINIMDAKDRISASSPKPTEMRLGNRVAMVDTNPNSPTYKQEVTSASIGTSPDAALSAATQRRGQDISAASAAASRAQADRHFNATQGQKPAGGVATEAERNAAGYLLRMEQATKLLDQFESKGATTYGTEIAGKLPLVGGAARRLAMSPEQGQYRQAQEDWVRAKLRKESGASIASDEMEREIETYFPMPGDSKQVISQKRQSRLVANDSFRSSAGRAAQPAQPASQSGGVVDFGSLK